MVDINNLREEIANSALEKKHENCVACTGFRYRKNSLSNQELGFVKSDEDNIGCGKRK